MLACHYCGEPVGSLYFGLRLGRYCMELGPGAERWRQLYEKCYCLECWGRMEGRSFGAERAQAPTPGALEAYAAARARQVV